MQFVLETHPATPPADPRFKLWVNVDYAAAFGATATANIWFGIAAPADRFLLPEAKEGRADQLWQTTCFEAFFRADGEDAYREWNFAPSGQWAAYDFTAYRQGMAEADVAQPPYIRVEDNLTWWALGATVALAAGPRWRLGLSAVIEERDGTKSYWALAHPPGDTPDFHHADGFAAHLT